MNNYKPMSESEQIEATISCLKQYQTNTGDYSLGDLEKQRIKFYAQATYAKEMFRHEVQKQVRTLKSPDQIKTQLITISIDQELTEAEAILKQKQTIEKIKQSKYKWMINSSYSFEYYSNNGWNPHIHIKIDKTIRDSQIAQMLRRKELKSVYNINVSSKTDEIHTSYIMGDKKEAKRENSERDQNFRKIHNIQDYYEM
uniref:hypothetical protein n=2 Tax=Pseudomonadota TaxID=1224 RepID=UPI00404889E3